MIESFLIKTEDHDYRLEHNIFHNNLKDNLYGLVYSNLQIFQIATNIGNHNRPSGGDNFTSKNFKKFSLVETLFKMIQDYSLQPGTLLNSVTDDFMRAF